MSNPRPAKRLRSVIACQRCKHRKQRCDNGFPACASCVAVDEICAYDNNVYPEEHVETLKARIQILEQQLAEQSKCSTTAIEVQRPAARSQVSDGQSTVPSDGTDTGFDMLSPDPSHLGISSGFSLATSVQAAIARAASGVPSTPLRVHCTATQGHLGPASSTTVQPKPRILESLHVRSRFLQAYLTKVHSKHMFLSPSRITYLNTAYQTLTQSTRETADFRPKSVLVRCEVLIMHMIYAIGARYLELSEERHHNSAEMYYAAALGDVECLFETLELESVYGLLLLAIYQLRSPSQTGLWSAISMAMGRAVSLGLHRKPHGASVVSEHRRKRVFWTIYMLDRTLARTLGRPYCISDRNIEIELPENVGPDVCLDQEDAMTAALQTDPGTTPMSAAIHIIRLARIESRIYHTLHRVDRQLSDLELASDKVLQLRQMLDEWRDQVPQSVPGSQDQAKPSNYYVKHEYHILQYHKAMLLLLLPSVSRLSAPQADFHLCVQSAGQVCQLYKRLHDDLKTLSYSLVALHATFVAGLTLIYCFLADRSIFNLQFSSDIRACSTVLYIISERWAAARKVRDAFEHMVSNTVEKPSFHGHNHSSAIDAEWSFQLTNKSGSSDLHEKANGLWSELVDLMPPTDGTMDLPQLGLHDPDDLWNSLGSWFSESEDTHVRGDC